MANRSRGWILCLALGAAVAVLPLAAWSDCLDFRGERLVLEPVSLEIDGAEVPGWPETTKGYEFRVQMSASSPDRLEFDTWGSSGTGVYRENFDANADSER